MASACAALCLAALCVPADAQEASNSATTSLVATFGSSLSYTDTRGSPVENGHDTVLQLSPGFQVITRSGKIRGTASYSLDVIRHWGEDGSSELQNSLTAAFNAEVVPGWMYLDANANVSQRSLSAFGQQSVDGSQQRNANRTEVGTVSLVPYVRGPLGSVATYDLRVNATATNGRRSIAADSTNTGGSIAINSVSSGALLGWGINAARQRSSFRVGRATETESVRASLLFRPDPELRFSLRGGEESTNVGNVDSVRSATWGADAQWTPNERTQATLSTDHRYFGRSHQITLSHRLPQSSFSFSSTQDASSSSDPNGVGQPVTRYQMYMALFTSQEPDPVLRDLFVRNLLRALGEDPDTVVSGGFINTAVTLQRREDLSWTYVGRRLTFSVQAFSSRSRVLDTLSSQPDDGVINQRGYVSTLSYRLTPTTAASLTGSRTMTQPSDTRPGTDLKSLSLSLTDQLGRRTSASLSARYSVFNSTTDPYRESSVSASLNMRF